MVSRPIAVCDPKVAGKLKKFTAGWNPADVRAWVSLEGLVTLTGLRHREVRRSLARLVGDGVVEERESEWRSGPRDNGRRWRWCGPTALSSHPGGSIGGTE